MRISDWSSDVCSSDSLLFGDTLGQWRGDRSFPCPRGACRGAPRGACGGCWRGGLSLRLSFARSGGRRVGKECVHTCRSRGAPGHLKKKQKNRRHISALATDTKHCTSRKTNKNT